MMQIKIKPHPNALYKGTDNWTFLQEKFKSILAGVDTKTMAYDELYGHAYSMVITGRGNILYEGVRKIVNNHIKQMAKQYQYIRENSSNSGSFLMYIDKAWCDFSEMMEKIRSILLYSERVFENSTGDESIVNFGWKVFRLELLENETIKAGLKLKLLRNPSQKAQLECLQNLEGDDVLAYNCSPIINTDVIIDVMGFLKTSIVGLKLGLICRHFAFLSDYIINKRKHTLNPIMICDGDEEGNTGTFAVPMKRIDVTPNAEVRRMTRVLDQWVTSLETANRFKLPKNEPPVWINGVELIYLTDGLNNDILTFFYAIRDKLHNCQLTFSLSSLWNRLHESKLFWSFLSLFNGLCFSLNHANVPLLNCTGCYFNENNQLAAQWPLWALFNNIYFTKCRELSIPIEFLNSPQNGLEAANWLQDSSTEKHPRKLKLCSNVVNWRLTSRGVPAMVDKLKEGFMNTTRKCTFFVEFPKEGLQNQEWGEWLNPIGEQLVVNQMSIKRVALEDGLKQFENFYEHLMVPEWKQPKILISAKKWVKKTNTPGTPVAVRRSSNNLTPVVQRKNPTPVMQRRFQPGN